MDKLGRRLWMGFFRFASETPQMQAARQLYQQRPLPRGAQRLANIHEHSAQWFLLFPRRQIWGLGNRIAALNYAQQAVQHGAYEHGISYAFAANPARERHLSRAIAGVWHAGFAERLYLAVPFATMLHVLRARRLLLIRPKDNRHSRWKAVFFYIGRGTR
jgi:hypothetical protein